MCPFLYLIKLPLVNNANRLSFAAGDALGGHQLDHGIDAQHSFESIHQFLFPCRDLGQGVGEHLRRHLHLDLQAIAVVLTADHDLVVGRISLVEQHRLDLGREDIDALDNQHIVAAAHGFGHACVRRNTSPGSGRTDPVSDSG